MEFLNETLNYKLLEKWGKHLQDVEDKINTEQKRLIIAGILENEERLFRNNIEMANLPEGITHFTVTNQGIARALFPIIKKAWKDTILDRIVSVQPIKSTLAYVRKIDYVYNKTAGDATAGQSVITTRTKQYSSVNLSSMEFNNASTWFDRDIDVKITRVAVEAGIRVLRAAWDLLSDYIAKLDNEQDLDPAVIEVLANKIRFEIETAVIDDMRTNAVHSESVSFDNSSPEAKDRSEKEVYHAVLKVAAKIAKAKYVNPNWLIMNPATSAVFERQEMFSVIYDEAKYISGIGRKLFGVINNRFLVIIDPQYPDNEILVGWKGPSILEAAYIYAPCVPLIVTDKYFDPRTVSYSRTLASIDATYLVDANYFGKVTLSGF
ncbi:MAG TPA: hypothetical protein ENG63_07675 [Candidatus Desulfofervidus auxilii]|uniref:Phage major capsid protein n=1 Tax=Desulfofervidus auxilii TaxID=1621989 RepID=A0A7C0U397_DESA2|nr:hypothetical protein [Candidatus Desulfofervidus auxilii]